MKRNGSGKNVTFSTACSNQPAIPSVPANTPYTGKYGFEISFQKQKKETKSATWTYSQELKKLFVRMRSPCPIRFRTAVFPPHGSVIRALPLYVKPEHIQEVVRRCPNHVSKQDASDTCYNGDNGMPTSSEHLLWCENKEAQYVEDAYTGRLSVVFPHELPQAGTEWVTNLFQFACFSSCVGGLNRRPLQVVFTLEQGTEVLGRQAVQVRICACPGRDRRTEEKSGPNDCVGKNNSSSGSAKSARSNASKEICEAGAMLNVTAPRGNLKRKRFYDGSSLPEDDDEDDDVYTLNICGRQNFEMLKRIKDSLELYDFIPTDQKSFFLQQMANNDNITPINTTNDNQGNDNSNRADNSRSDQMEHSNFLPAQHLGSNYINAYVINNGHDVMSKNSNIDQSLLENEVTSTEINLHLVDIHRVLTPQSPLTPLISVPPPSSPLVSAQSSTSSSSPQSSMLIHPSPSSSSSSFMGCHVEGGVLEDGDHVIDVSSLPLLQDLQTMSVQHQHNNNAIYKKVVECRSKNTEVHKQPSFKALEPSQARQTLAPISEFQHRPPPFNIDNNTTIVTFSDKFPQQSQQLIQLQQIIVNNSASKIELLTPVYYKNCQSHSTDFLNISGQDHNYCGEVDT